MVADLEFKVLHDFTRLNTYTGTVRFTTQKVETKDGTILLRKQLNDPNEADALVNEVDFANWVEESKIELGFDIPGVVHSGVDKSVIYFKWIDASILIDEEELVEIDEATVDRCLNAILSLRNEDFSSFTGRAIEHCATWSDHLRELHAVLVGEGSVDDTTLARALDLFESLPNVTPGFAHGDLMGWHIFDTEPLTLLDWEHASHLWPEHQDFARFWAQAAARNGMGSAIMEMPAKYAAALGIAEEELWINAGRILLSHCVFRVADSVRDHGVGREDIRGLSANLLNYAVERLSSLS